MPDQDNVQLDKVSLDFTEELSDNDFGIQDTQVLATKELNRFLLSDPDEIKKVDDDKDADKQQQNQNQDTKNTQNPDKNKQQQDKKEEEKKPDGKEALDKILFGDQDADGEDKKPLGTDDPITKKTNDAGSEGGDDTFTTLGRDLLRLGVFSKNSEDESEESLTFKSGEEFLERFNLEKKKGAINILDNFLGQFGEDYRKMFDAVFVNGVKPQEYLTSFAKIEAISTLDLSNEENQERIVRAYYKGLKWDDAKIESKITKMKDYGDLEDEAKTYHQVLLDKEKEQVAAIERTKQEEAQKEKDKAIASKKSYQRILTEKLKNQEFDGLPLTQKEVEEAIDYLSEKKYKLATGELLSEYDKDILELNRPENHELKVKLGLLLRKKLDLTTVRKTAVSKKSDALFTLSTKNAKQQNSKEKEMKSFF